VEEFVDINFEYHKALGLVWLNVALQLVTTPLLPFNVTDYAIFMKKSASEFAQLHEQTLLEQNITLSEFQDIKSSISYYESSKQNYLMLQFKFSVKHVLISRRSLTMHNRESIFLH